MKFKDMKTGKIYDNFSPSVCENLCSRCGLSIFYNGEKVDCQEYIERHPEAVSQIGWVPVYEDSTEDDSDKELQGIIERYTLECISLLKKSISDTILHAVEENRKLREENERLRQQNSSLKKSLSQNNSCTMNASAASQINYLSQSYRDYLVSEQISNSISKLNPLTSNMIGCVSILNKR